MNMACDKYAIDIVSFKRPTALDKLAETIPKPKGAVPNFGLPKWKVMPLESKIPMVPGPEGAYNFTRNKIGKRLWVSAPDAEFNLSDPYGYEMQLAYDSLHDKHLVPYFSRPNIVRHLIKSGFVTKNLDAKCSLRDYNMYRRYLRRLHCDRIRKELKRITKESVEERAIQYAQEQAEKEVKRLKERDRLLELKSSTMEERRLAEKLKREQQKEKQRKIEERLRALHQRKQEDIRLRHIRSKERADLLRQKQKVAMDYRRKKIIQTLLEWNRKERKRKKMMEKRLAREREQKQQMVEQKWEERQEFQKKQIEKEQLLLQCIEAQRKEFIDNYKEKVNRETERMKKLFRDMKMYIKCYLARRLPGSRERICCKKYLDDDDDDDYEDKTFPSRIKADKKKDISISYTVKQDKYEVRKSLNAKKRGKEKSVTNAKLKGKIRKKKKSQQKMKGVAMHMSVTTDKKRKRRKKRRKGTKDQDAEIETKSESVALPESISSPKLDSSEVSTVSAPLDRCRCQIIKDLKKAIV